MRLIIGMLHKTICIDVDGTLIFWDGPDPGSARESTSYTPNHELIRKIKEEWQGGGYTLILWSARGRDVAEKIAHELDLFAHFSLITRKPFMYVDDHFRWEERIKRIGPNDT